MMIWVAAVVVALVLALVIDYMLDGIWTAFKRVRRRSVHSGWEN